ncbi:peptide chain release factor 1 [Silvanigrella aquatica]|uniref:Peptide chain release factor 1 n=1 Tax=Silvanigrella aquatica TaxID=1915309 RepID=A0A1L4D3L2_9BACT|nr:peptide chain release factor 1 [Silvanigrella aquatica]APJ04791.1 peptide chain release factor 1 [Silvanigrella aquatica]
MMTQLAKIERRFLELESLLSRPEVISNNNEFRKFSKERADLEETVRLYREFKKIEEDSKSTEELLEESTGEMKDLAFDELKSLKKRHEELEKELAIHLLPKDPNDSKNVFLEIRAGAGGDEASLFAGQLFRAYSRYVERKKWKMEIMSLNENELGGTKEVIALIEGEGVYSILKYESGVHRVQRVPQTEAQGRVHTSTITVAILPEADDVEVSINENDLRIDTYRAGGAGGQHVNRTDSAVRITHIPSGIVVACQDERSQIKNRSKAMKILQAKLLEAVEIEKEKAFSEERKSQVGRGDRSERIRTYNFPQSRVTDHRINHTIHSIDAFMEGEIQEMLNLLRQHYQAEELKLQAEGK